MDSRSLSVPLKGFGEQPTQAHLVVQTLSPRARLARGATVVAAGLAVAVIALPIPLVHLILVPAALLLSVPVGVLRMRHREIFRLAEGTCPFCGTPQRFGLAGRVFRLPREVFCSKCGRALDLGRG
jgi:hypothetical protein